MQVFANYGAMFPVEALTIHTISGGIGYAKNEDGENRTVTIEAIRDARPESGSPIGVYWNEIDAY